MDRKFLNMGLDNYVYSGLTERSNIVGVIDPTFLDFDNLPESDLFGYRECNCVIENDHPSKKDGKTQNYDFEYYITDYLWLLCNFSCPYCLTDSPEHTQMKTESISVEKRLNWLKYFTAHKSGNYCYRIFGGEPTLYRGFEEVVRFVDQDETCVACKISTNASHIDRLSVFFEEGTDRDKFLFDVSIHPLDEKFDWEKTKCAIEKLYENNYSVFVIGVDLPIIRQQLDKYSCDLKASTGIDVALFENLREDKYK